MREVVGLVEIVPKGVDPKFGASLELLLKKRYLSQLILLSMGGSLPVYCFPGLVTEG